MTVVARLVGWSASGHRVDMPASDRLSLKDDGYWVEQAGVRVNGASVDRALVRHLDVISIDNLDLVFVTGARAIAANEPLAEVAPPAPPAEREWQTRIMWPGDLGADAMSVILRDLAAPAPQGSAPPPSAPTSPAPPPAAAPRGETIYGAPPFEGSIPTAVLAAGRAPDRPIAAPVLSGIRLTGDAGTFTLGLGRSIIGRGPEAAVRIDRRDISRLHAALVVTPADATVEDQGSTNGTKVNDAAITGAHRLASGDRLSLGKVELRVELLQGDAG
jgi:hypothetical protein